MKNMLKINNNVLVLLLILNLLAWIPMGYFDSVRFSEIYFNGKFITTTIIIFLFCFLFLIGTLRLKLLLLIIVPLSYLREVIFSELLNLYTYREEE